MFLRCMVNGRNIAGIYYFDKEGFANFPYLSAEFPSQNTVLFLHGQGT